MSEAEVEAVKAELEKVIKRLDKIDEDLDKQSTTEKDRGVLRENQNLLLKDKAELSTKLKQLQAARAGAPSTSGGGGLGGSAFTSGGARAVPGETGLENVMASMDLLELLSAPTAVYTITVSIFNMIGARAVMFGKMQEFDVFGEVRRVSPYEVKCILVHSRSALKIVQLLQWIAYSGYAVLARSRADVSNAAPMFVLEPVKIEHTSDPSFIKWHRQRSVIEVHRVIKLRYSDPSLCSADPEEAERSVSSHRSGADREAL